MYEYRSRAGGGNLSMGAAPTPKRRLQWETTRSLLLSLLRGVARASIDRGSISSGWIRRASRACSIANPASPAWTSAKTSRWLSPASATRGPALSDVVPSKTISSASHQTCAIVPLAKAEEQNVMGEPFTFEPDGMGWGTPDNVYAVAQYDLADDEVLVIHGRSPKCCYWGVQTWNPYMQSDDYRYHRVSLNSSQVQLNDDETWTVHLSKDELDVPNWVGTAGHADGLGSDLGGGVGREMEHLATGVLVLNAARKGDRQDFAVRTRS